MTLANYDNTIRSQFTSKYIIKTFLMKKKPLTNHDIHFATIVAI